MMFALPRLSPLLAWLLAAVLVLTQTLSLVHGIEHGKTHSAVAHHHHHDGKDCETHHHHGATALSAQSFLADLFDSHQQESDCRLYDQASHDGGLVAVMQLLLPVVPPPFSVAIFQGEALARWAALFDARGPPLTV
jgi:hypothetical protein